MSMTVDQQIKVTLKDGSVREFAAGTTVGEVAAALSNRLRKEAVAGTINGQTVELWRPILTDANVEIFTLDDPVGLDTMRHSCAHVMAQAVARLWPDTKFAIGPVIENGFYYDFADHDFAPEDLPLIEQEMQKIIKED
ncbi:MAG: threonine--tRNA ligase [Bacilli bacterium]|nr:threonine--tRNA ligase [Bacilli bacterium]